ncbi:outer membrane beta-barrel family protein [Pontibacter mangrovi]|uniref:TonB-dependent receptor n=1 Tax=Pontibacter mangrovi TaxID=2589816 RepID=A0A501WF84_9BACT|nr:outer membrane beta-barrel family protein [Pontibacter mangrovi]TPE45841.1 TonB-dependent receptor [Pontibacter mangrovi]
MKKASTTILQAKAVKQVLRLVYLICGFSIYITATPILAQTTPTVSGIVADAATQSPLAYTSIVLLHLPDSAVAASEMTESGGTYTFSEVKPGIYVVKALMVGFNPAASLPFEVKQQAVVLPALKMQQKANELQEVVVQGQKPLLEQQPDRLVMNVEQLNTAGDNALEVLKYAPGVRLDKDENILFRGNGSVNVMINGKMTYMTNAELRSYLKSLPAATVSKVELMANPPASFDAAGTGGVINILLKRDETMGLNGSANLSLGQGKYEKVRAGVNLNYNTGKVSLFTRLNAGHYNSFNRLTLRRNINDSLYNQVNYWHPITKSYNLTAGADYFINARHTVGVMAKSYISPSETMVTSNSVNYDAEGALFGRMAMRNPEESSTDNYSVNLNYKFEIDSTGRALSFDADYVTYGTQSNEQFTNHFYGAAGEATQVPVQLRSANGAEASIKSLKLDYVHPFGNDFKAEAGWKSSWVRNNSDVKFEELQEQGWVNDTMRTNSFLYNENINAAYLSLSKQFSEAFSIKAGVRAEQTNAEGHSVTKGEEVDRNYLKLFPSLFVSYKADENNQFSASYSRRISRPSYSRLNPFTSFSDPYTAMEGNPFLQPSFSNSLQVNYTYKNFQLLSLSYLETNDFVMNVIEQNDETKVSISKPQNLSKATDLTLSSGGTLPLTDWLSSTLQLEGSYSTISTPLLGENYNTDQFTWSASTDQTVTLPKAYKLQLSAYYISPSVQGLHHMKAGYQIDLGAKKELWNGKATLGLKLRDVFNTSRWRSTLQYANVNMFWQNQWESRRLDLSFDIKFGNSKVKTARNRKTGTGEEEGRL